MATTPTAPLPPAPTGRARFTPLGVWAVLGAATAFVLTFNPTDRLGDPTGPCLWHTLTGIDGPTCGGTRMFWYLIHGNPVQSARHHLAALVGLLYGGYALVAWTSAWLVGRQLPLWRPSTRIWIIYGAVFLLYSVVLRNLPWPPFTWF